MSESYFVVADCGLDDCKIHPDALPHPAAAQLLVATADSWIMTRHEYPHPRRFAVIE